MLNALNEYHSCLCEQENSPLSPKGYSKVLVNFNIVLTKDGKLKEILPYTRKVIKKVKGKEKEEQVPQEEIFPLRNSISGIAPETIDHREKYIFGVEWDKNNEEFILGKSSVQAFEKNKAKIFEFFDNAPNSSQIIDSYKIFVDNWVPENELNNEVLLNISKDYNGAKFVISLENTNTFLHNDRIVKTLWDDYLLVLKSSSKGTKGQCAISGKSDVEIARLHTKLKGIAGGQASGVGLVSFNNSAFESYGKEQSYNSSISQEVMENYTEAFNHLSFSLEHKQIVDDMTLLFWAMTNKNEKPFVQTFSNIMGFPSNAENTQNAEVSSANESLKSIFSTAVKGVNSDIESFEDYESVEFYILGIKPNTSRLSVKLFCHNTFGKMMENINQHHLNMQFNENDRQIPIWIIKEQLKSPISKKDLPPDLSVKMFHSILTNSPYPRFLLDTVIYRAKTDQDEGKKFQSVNRTRVRIIKAVLTRLNKIKREDFTMLNTENKDVAYNCGRLFAILEVIQRKALGENVNATIKDRFFASACSTPYLVFPRLIKLTQNHLGKIDGGLKVHYDMLLGQVIGNLNDSFPKALNMESQGIFILGYYQQKEDLFTKKSNKNEVIGE